MLAVVHPPAAKAVLPPKMVTALAAAQQAAGQHAEAEETYGAALAVRRRAGDRHGEAETLRDSGDLLHHLGRPGAAHASWQQALVAFEELGDPQADDLRARLKAQAAQ
jgi:tetratricopeptide (TPR) repeat protein